MLKLWICSRDYPKRPGLENNPEKKARIAFENLRCMIAKYKDKVKWEAPDITMCRDKIEIDGLLAMDKQHVFYRLLVHPKVAECAANIVNNAKETRESIIGSAKTALSLYQDPLIKRNTAQQAVSLYLVLQPMMSINYAHSRGYL